MLKNFKARVWKLIRWLLKLSLKLKLEKYYPEGRDWGVFGDGDYLRESWSVWCVNFHPHQPPQSRKGWAPLLLSSQVGSKSFKEILGEPGMFALCVPDVWRVEMQWTVVWVKPETSEVRSVTGQRPAEEKLRNCACSAGSWHSWSLQSMTASSHWPLWCQKHY